MRTVWTDKYAITVWLPSGLGIGYLALWLADDLRPWDMLVFGCVLLIVGIKCAYSRWQKPQRPK